MIATIRRINRSGAIKYFVAILLLVFCFGTMQASAQTPPPDAPAEDPEGFSGFGNIDDHKNDCSTVDGAVVNSENCEIINYLVVIINTLSALVGVIIVAAIVTGGIQYTSAGDDPQKIKAAKARIMNAIIAFLMFIFMFAFLQWVVPGGVL